MVGLRLALSGLVMFGVVVVTDPAAAVPPVSELAKVTGEPAHLVPVRGCHRGVQHHYVPEVGRSMRHYHRGGACKPYDANWKRSRGLQCHRDVRYHYVPEVNRRVWHFHRKKTCQPIAADGRRRGHCHRSAEIHSHKGWGKVVHRHVGSACRVDPFRGYKDPWSGGGCILFCL